MGLGAAIFWGLLENHRRQVNEAFRQEVAAAKALGLPLVAADVELEAPSAESDVRWQQIKRFLRPPTRNSPRTEDWLPASTEAEERQRETRRQDFASSRWNTERLAELILEPDDFRPIHDWTVVPVLDRPELSFGRPTVDILGALAAARAAEGDRAGAQQALRAAVRFVDVITKRPTTTDAAVRNRLHLQIDDAALTLCALDPPGASGYLEIAANRTELNPSFFFRDLILAGIYSSRNSSARELSTIRTSPIGLPEIPVGELARRRRESDPTGLFQKETMTAMLGAWRKIYATADKSGQFNNIARAKAAYQAEVDRLTRSSSRVDQIAGYYLKPQAGMFSIYQQAQSQRRMMAALSKVLKFRDANRRWPKSLAEAGVEPIPDPNSPNGVAKYSAGPEGVAIWMVGENGNDDGGYLGTRNEGDWAVGLPVSRIARKPQNP